MRWETVLSWYDWIARVHFAGTLLSGGLGVIAGVAAYFEGWDWLSIILAMIVAFAGVAVLYIAACLFWDHRKPVELDSGGDLRKPADQGTRPVKIYLGTGAGFESVERAGVNRRRTVKAKIENNADTDISDGQLDILNLDPPNNGQTDFLLRGAIAVMAHKSAYAAIACYDEGTSSGALPGTVIRLCLPPMLGLVSLPLPGELPIQPHIFQLRFSSAERGTHDDIYCRLFLDGERRLRLENWSDSSTAETSISLHDAAVRLYEAAEEHGFLDFLVNVGDSPDKRLEDTKHQLIVDERVNLSGIRSPSTISRVIRRDELTYEMFPGTGSTIIDTHSNEVTWSGVSLPIRDLNVVIADFIEHNKKASPR